MKKPLWKQKTFWAGLSGIVSGAALIANGNVAEGVPLVIISLSQIFQRQATNNS